MPKSVDYTGKRFGRLTVIERSKNISKYIYKWICKCDCGNIVEVIHGNLQSDHTKSCGCLSRERASKSLTTHGMSHNNRLFTIWCSMRQRCKDKNQKFFHRYGGRGIIVCSEWQEFLPFYNWAIANGYKEGLSIDRINNDSGYSPDNCRWANNFQQANNTSANHKITFDGETHTLAEWERIRGYIPNTIHTRLKRGWTEKEAIIGIRKNKRRKC